MQRWWRDPRRPWVLLAILVAVPLVSGCVAGLDPAPVVAAGASHTPAPSQVEDGVTVVTDAQGDAYEKNADWARDRPYRACPVAEPVTMDACRAATSNVPAGRGDWGTDGVIEAPPSLDVTGISLEESPTHIVATLELAALDEAFTGWQIEGAAGPEASAGAVVGWRLAGEPECGAWIELYTLPGATEPRAMVWISGSRCLSPDYGGHPVPYEGDPLWGMEPTFTFGEPGTITLALPRELLLGTQKGGTLVDVAAETWRYEHGATNVVDVRSPGGERVARSRLWGGSGHYLDLTDTAGTYTFATPMEDRPTPAPVHPLQPAPEGDVTDGSVDIVAYDIHETPDTITYELTLADVSTVQDYGRLIGYYLEFEYADGSLSYAWVENGFGTWTVYAVLSRPGNDIFNRVYTTLAGDLEVTEGRYGTVGVTFDRSDLPVIEAGTPAIYVEASAREYPDDGTRDVRGALPLSIDHNFDTGTGLEDWQMDWSGVAPPYYFEHSTSPDAYRGIIRYNDPVDDTVLPPTVLEEGTANTMDITSIEARARTSGAIELTLGVADLSDVVVPTGYEAVYYAFGLQMPGAEASMVGYYKPADVPAGTFLCAQDTAVVADERRDPTAVVWTVIDGFLTGPRAGGQGAGGPGSLTIQVPYACLGAEEGLDLEDVRLEAATFLVRNPTGRAGLGEVERVDETAAPGLVTILAHEGEPASSAPAGGPGILGMGTASSLLWAASSLLLIPLTYVGLQRHRVGDRRAEEHAIYRAAIEQKLVAGKDVDADDEVLMGLRRRFGISDRDHGLIVEHVQAGLGRSYVSMAPGAKYLDRYQVQEVLGEGGFSRTYLAHDDVLGREVVLKVARWDTEREQRRALKEARTLAGIDHPNVVRVLDVERLGDEVVQVLEYVPNGSLADRLADGPMRISEATLLARDLMGALAAAHAVGVVHRDVKPANILLTAAGRAKLCDFGIAREDGSGTVSVMGADAGAGTVLYMSPEQAKGGELDVRSDVYAAAVVLYEALAGRHYLDVEGLAEFEVRLAIVDEPPRLPIDGVPGAVNEVLGRALAKDADLRPPSAQAFHDELSAATLEG